jgi:hypothetical protein
MKKYFLALLSQRVESLAGRIILVNCREKQDGIK